MKKRYWLFLVFIVIACTYFLGPKAPIPEYNPIITSKVFEVSTVEDFISRKESTLALRPKNEAQIVWADSPGVKTPYSIVYLHGFGASREEGSLLHRRLAENFGMNLYLARLCEHGIDTQEPLLEFSAECLVESAKEAISIGQSLGEDVIVMGTSTGATCALYLAAHNPELIDAIMLYSPNIRLYDKRAGIITKPWGLQIARKIAGSKYRHWEGVPDEAKKYWYVKQRIEAVVALQSLIESTMKQDVFEAIDQPVLMTYYYRDEDNQDHTVSVPHMIEMYAQLGTPENKKMSQALPNGQHHIITSEIFSGDLDGAYTLSHEFLSNILKLKTVE